MSSTGGNQPQPDFGNFKGVMLCNRPSNPKGVSTSAVPFRSTVSASYNQPLGLQPCADRKIPAVQKKEGSAAMAIQRHWRFIRKLQAKVQGQMKGDQAAQQEQQREQAKQRVRMFCEKQREAVRNMKIKDAKKKEEASESAAREQVARELAEQAASGKKRDLKLARLAADKKGKESCCQASVGSVPAWALTAEQAAEMKEEETERLVEYAQGLDLDKYLEDLEFKTALKVLETRAKAIDQANASFRQALADAFNQDIKEDAKGASTCRGEVPIFPTDSASQCGMTEETMSVDSKGRPAIRTTRKTCNRKEGTDWDSSTVCADKSKTKDRPQMLETIEEALENEKIRSVHSKQSVGAILAKQSSEEPQASGLITPLSDALIQEMKKFADLKLNPEAVGNGGPTLIVNQEDQRLREADPSNLPYLHRNPAV